MDFELYICGCYLSTLTNSTRYFKMSTTLLTDYLVIYSFATSSTCCRLPSLQFTVYQSRGCSTDDLFSPNQPQKVTFTSFRLYKKVNIRSSLSFRFIAWYDRSPVQYCGPVIFLRCADTLLCIANTVQY